MDIPTTHYYGHAYYYPHRNFDRRYEIQRWELRWGPANYNFFTDGPEPPYQWQQPWAHTHYTWRPVTPVETVRNQYYYYLGNDDTSADSELNDDTNVLNDNAAYATAQTPVPLLENRFPDTTGQNSHEGRQIQRIYMQYTEADSPPSLRALAAYAGTGGAATAA